MTTMVERAWQPIETAPKDGTRILAMWGDKIQIIYWHESASSPPGYGPFRNWLSDGRGVAVNLRPTHWMPLPEPPKDAALSESTSTPANGDAA